MTTILKEGNDMKYPFARDEHVERCDDRRVVQRQKRKDKTDIVHRVGNPPLMRWGVGKGRTSGGATS